MPLPSKAGMRLALKLGKLKLPKRMPVQAEPNTQRASYTRALLKGPWGDLFELVRKALTPAVLERLTNRYAAAQGAKADASDDDVGDIFDDLEEQYRKLWPRKRLERLALKNGEAVDKFQTEQLNKQLRTSVGIDVFGGEPEMRPVLGVFARENVALVGGATKDFISDLEKRLMKGLADGQRAPALAEEIEERFGVGKSRAALIARDQVGKLYGDLNRVRQSSVGIEGYIWRTVRDNRVREEHEEREGSKFSWASPPDDGHPGEAINCRCYAEPDLSALLE